MQSLVKRICPEEVTVPVKEGVSAETLDVALIVKLVVSDVKLTLVPALMHLMFAPSSSCSASVAVNPVKLFCFPAKAVCVKLLIGFDESEVLSTLPMPRAAFVKFVASNFYVILSKLPLILVCQHQLCYQLNPNLKLIW